MNPKKSYIIVVFTVFLRFLLRVSTWPGHGRSVGFGVFGLFF